MQEMVKLADGTWTYNASSPPAERNVDLPEEAKPRRKSARGEKKARQ